MHGFLRQVNNICLRRQYTGQSTRVVALDPDDRIIRIFDHNDLEKAVAWARTQRQFKSQDRRARHGG